MCETNPIGGGSGLVAWGESVCQGPTRADEVGRGRPSYEETPGGVTTSAPRGQLCETNPIGPEPNTSQVPYGTAVMSASASEGLGKTNPIWSAPRGRGISPVSPDHGRDAHVTHGQDAHATARPGGDSVNLPAGQGRLCEANRIGAFRSLAATETGRGPAGPHCDTLDGREKTCLKEAV